MSTFLIILFLILYLFIAFARIDWAMIIMIALLPSYLIRFHVFSIPFTLLEGMILISFGAWFFGNWRSLLANLRAAVPFGRLRRDGGRYPFNIEIILLLIISYIAAAVAGFGAGALGIWKAYFFEPLLVYVLAVNVAFLPILPRLDRGLAASAAIGEAKASEPGLKPGRSGAHFGRIIWPLAISAFAVSVFAIYQKFTGAFIANPFWAAEAVRRVTSFFEYPNAVGLYLGPMIILLTGWMFSEFNNIKRENKIYNFQFSILKQFSIFNFKNLLLIILIGTTIILSLMAICFAKSEGAIIGVVAGLIVFGLLAGKKARWAAIAMIVVFGAGIAAYQPIRSKAVEKFTLSDLSGEIRKQQWRETWQMLTESPNRFVFGAGLDNYQTAIKPYHQEGIFFNKDNDPDFHRKLVLFNDNYKKKYWQPAEIYKYPHNIFLNFWSELGLTGVLLFIWIIAKYFRMGISNFQFPISNKIKNSKLKIQNFAPDKYLRIGLISAMVAIIVHGLVDVPYFKNDLAVLFWLLMAVMGIIKIKSEKNHINHINPC